MLLGEFLPFEVPQFDVLLLSLVALAGFMVALGLISVLQAFTRGVVGGIAKILGIVPVIGPVLASPVNDVYKWLDSELGEAAVALDKQIGRYLHTLGLLFDWIGRELADLGAALYITAQHLAGSAQLSDLYGWVDKLIVRVRAAQASAEAEAARLFGLTQHGIDSLAGRLTHGLEAAERVAEGEAARVAADLRVKARDLERDYERLYQRIRRLNGALVGAGAAALVTAALARLGLSWIKCRNWKRLGREVCGLPTNWISDLLGLVTDFLVLTDICAVIPWLEDAFSVTAAPLVSALTTAGAGICNPNAKHPPTMNAPAPPAVPLYLTTLAVPGETEYVASGDAQRVILLPGPVL